MIPLAKLNPKWIGRLRPPEHGEGVAFDCPTCGPGHTLVAYFSNPLDRGPVMPMPPEQTWQRHGEDLARLTVTPSLNYPCWHGWVVWGIAIPTSEGTPAEMRAQDGSPLRVMLSPLQVLELLAAEQDAAGRTKTGR